MNSFNVVLRTNDSKDKGVKRVNPLEDNLKKFHEIADFFKSFDEEQIEMFIKYGNENVKNFGDEEGWRKVICKFKSENSFILQNKLRNAYKTETFRSY
jgi:hypothetical protein